jgi:hypothetical protein
MMLKNSCLISVGSNVWKKCLYYVGCKRFPSEFQLKSKITCMFERGLKVGAVENVLENLNFGYYLSPVTLQTLLSCVKFQ